MKKIMIIALIAVFTIVSFGCKKDTGSSEIPVAPITESAVTTGTISGSLADTATITVTQADGTTQSANTSSSNPDYVFNDVPQGETTLTFQTAGGTTTQTVQVNGDQTTEVNPFGSTQELLNSLKGQVYEMPANSSSISQVTTTPIGEPFYTREINVPNRSFEEGFPGITDRFEWFAVIYEGKITAPTTGTYTFQISSDDGSMLYINGQTVVSNDGNHGSRTRSGTIELVAGQQYDIVIKYYQGPRYCIECVVKAQLPGGEMKLFNMSDFAS